MKRRQRIGRQAGTTGKEGRVVRADNERGWMLKEAGKNEMDMWCTWTERKYYAHGIHRKRWFLSSEVSRRWRKIRFKEE